eukprot:109485_1
MDDFGFGEDPDADRQFDEDCAVLNEIEHDLGKSYISERVTTPARSKAFNAFHGQSFTPLHQSTNDGYEDDEDEEKQIELIQETPLNRNHRPLTRKRKRHREECDGEDLSILPNAKRHKANDTLRVDSLEQSFDEIYLHSRPSLHDTSVMITNETDGEQLYVYYTSQSQYDREIKNCHKELNRNIRSLSHLGTIQQNKTIDQLLDEIENERIAKQISELNQNFLNIEQENTDPNVPQQLWVDKYAPKRITDLLSHEQINREVTTWVKQWDYAVFGYKYSRFHAKNKEKEKKKEKKKKKTRVNMYNMFGGSDTHNTNSKPKHKANALNRKPPEIAVLLFCGAPGTGKSTLAHMVANHCGYRPFEINASNERSGKKLKDIIINAATMKPMFGDTRPPLIIMDEIDGALRGNGDSKSAVDVILRIVKNKEIMRPIICICNNEYSPALRPLRAICTIHKFKPIATRTLCKRLLDISRKEYLHTNLKTLSYLANITNNDIRSCLHTLQFFKERSNGNGARKVSSRLTIDTLQKTPIGRKDKTQNIFDIWNKILKKKKQTNTHAAKQKTHGMNEHWKTICSMMYGFGGNDAKIVNGVIQNYLKLGYTDPMFEVSFETAQWITQYDELQHKIAARQQFALMGYLPFIMIGIHNTCGTDTFKKLEYPSGVYKQRMARKQNMTIVHQYLSGLQSDLDVKSCALELIPFIPFLIFTNKRWNNSDFDHNNTTNNYNKKYPSNKRHFVSIINTMIECGLTYVSSNASSHLRLQPPIDQLSVFSFSNPKFKELAQYTFMNQYLKEKIAHQIVLETMRRSEAGVHKYREKEDKMNTTNKATNAFTPVRPHKPSNARATPFGRGQFGTHKPSNAQSQTQTVSQTPAKFKHFIAAHNKQTKIKKYEYPIQYRFVEGYTNAVKRKSFCRDWV